MSAEELIGAVEKFFLDVIGTVLPGALFLTATIASTTIVFCGSDDLGSVLWNLRPNETVGWAAWVAAAFITGHAVASIGDNVVLPLVDATLGRVYRKPGLRFIPFVGRFKSDRDLFSELRSKPIFERVIRYYNDKAGINLTVENTKSLHFVRNLAIGLLGEEKYTVYRFMFLSLLNLGVATTCATFGLAALVLWITNRGLALSVGEWTCPLWGVGVLALLAAVPFLERRYRFYEITMSVPFSMAATRMIKPQS